MALLQDYLWFFCHHSWQQCLFLISDLNYFSHHSILITIIYYFWLSCSLYQTDGHQFVSHSLYESWKWSCIFCLASLWEHVLLGTGCRLSFCCFVKWCFQMFPGRFWGAGVYCSGFVNEDYRIVYHWVGAVFINNIKGRMCEWN